MEEGVQVRVQVECGREEVEDWEKHGERQNEEATRNRRSNAHDGWHEDGMTRAYRHLSHAVWCTSIVRCENCMRKNDVRGVSVYILENARIGPVLNIKVCCHDDRYSIDVLVESLFLDRTASLVRIVSGIDKYVTESMQTKEEEHRASGLTCCESKTTTEARSEALFRVYSCSWQKLDRHWTTTITWSNVLSSVKSHDPIATHDRTVPREIDGAVLFDHVLEECKKKKVRWWFAMVTQRLNISSGKKEEESRKGFNIIAWIQTFPATSCISEQFKDIQEIMLLILSCETMGFTEYIYHVGNASEMNSIIRSGLIPGGRRLKRGSQSVFLTMTNPMEKDNGMVKTPCDLTSQGSRHTRILGNIFKTLFIGAISSSLRGQDCNFIKHCHMQSFSTAFCPPFALRKRYVWKRRRSSTKKNASLQDCHKLYSKRTSNMVNKIHKAMTQNHLKTIKRFEEKQGNLENAVDYRIPGVPFSVLKQKDTHI